MTNKNFIDVENCLPRGYRLDISCKTGDILLPNEIVVEDNINAALKDIQNTILALDKRNCELYDYIEYFGWLGPNPETLATEASALSACRRIYWEDVDCITVPSGIITWGDLECTGDPQDTNTDACRAYKAHECKRISCFGKYCTDWNWEGRSSENALLPITWKMTREDGPYEKLWIHESCELNDSTQCDEGTWNVNIPLIDGLYDPVGNCDVTRRCMYTGIASRDNILYVSGRTTVKVLSSDYDATELGVRSILDETTGLYDIRGLAIDSNNTIFIVDRYLHTVAGFSFNPALGTPWELKVMWGGFGSIASPNRFLRPNDIHIDKYDNVWVSDTGNKGIKQYTNTGSWIQTITDPYFNSAPPLSLAVDEIDQVHVLTKDSVRVFSYTGQFIFSYPVDTTTPPKKINTNFNKQLLYVTYQTSVRKYIRTGTPFDYLVKDKACVDYIDSVYQDEYRNTLVTFGDKIIKFVHILKQRRTKSELPPAFWSIDNILIHKDEYIQDWVYNKAFQRMWDNIEMFRLSLYYDGTYCKGYKPPVYDKNEVFIGQNEIVSTVVVNRCLQYLWTNLCTLINFYYNPDCREPEKLEPICERPTVTWHTERAQATWLISVGNTVARLVIDDNCPAIPPALIPPTTTFYGAATALITTPVSGCKYKLRVNTQGYSILPTPQLTPRQEIFKVTFNGADILEARPTGSALPDTCTGNTVIVNTLGPNTEFDLLPNQTYTLVCKTETDLALYNYQHSGAFYEVQLSIT